MTSLLDNDERHLAGSGPGGVQRLAVTVLPRLRLPRGRRPGRGGRLGSRIPPRCLASATPRVRRRPHSAVHRDSAAVAAGTGQTVGAVATVDRAGPGSRRRQTGRCDHTLRPVPRRHRDRSDRPGSTGRCWNATCRPARRFRQCPTSRHPHRIAQPLLRRDPPTPLGHNPSRRCDVLHRGLPETRRTAAAGAGRAGHGPARASGQPRPLRRPRPPADHDDPDALWAAGHRRAAAARRLPRHRRRRRSRICATSTTR